MAEFTVLQAVLALLSGLAMGFALSLTGAGGSREGSEDDSLKPVRNWMSIRPVIILAALHHTPPAGAQPAAHHEHAGHLGASVMPFDLARSIHVFTPTSDGGTQEVISKDGDPAQIALIREHLRKEAAAFARGDYSDPTSIHGPAMPGVTELAQGAGRVHVVFEEMPQRCPARLRDVAGFAAASAAGNSTSAAPAC